MAAIGSLLSKASRLRLYNWRELKKTLDLANQHVANLKTQVNVEGEKIERYISFMRIQSLISSSVRHIIRLDEIFDDDDEFWRGIEEPHGELEARLRELRAFDTGLLDVAEADRIRIYSNQVADHCTHAEGLFTARSERATYVRYIRQAAGSIAEVHTTGDAILTDIGYKLRNFEGAQE